MSSWLCRRVARLSGARLAALSLGPCIGSAQAGRPVSGSVCLAHARRCQSSNNSNGSGDEVAGDDDWNDDDEAVRSAFSDLATPTPGGATPIAQPGFKSPPPRDDSGAAASGASTSRGTDAAGAGGAGNDIVLERLPRPPAKFDLLTTTSVFKWRCTAKQARKISGPMREWSDELQCRSGVHVQVEVVHPDRANAGDYASPDDVETNVYFFGSDKSVQDALPFVRAMIGLDPCYVRLAVFRRKPGSAGAAASSATTEGTGGALTVPADVEWLTLRRINRDNRAPDIPPISLKTPGKWTMLFEGLPEAATRSLYEETGIEVDQAALMKTNYFLNKDSKYWWRPPVHYYIAEVPYDVTVLGPQSSLRSYVLDWDPRILRQSPDAIDRAWAQYADPKTGCAWLSASVIDELQKPVKNEQYYMASRYTPSVESELQKVLNLGPIDPVKLPTASA